MNIYIKKTILKLFVKIFYLSLNINKQLRFKE